MRPSLGVPPTPIDDCPVFRQIVEFRFLEIWALGLEPDFSQLLSDWSRHCYQASSLVLQECVDQSDDVPLFPLTGETSLKRHDQYGPEHVNTDYHLHTTNCMVI